MGREVQKGEGICISMADSCLRFDRKQQNSVKQLSFNLKKSLFASKLWLTYLQIVTFHKNNSIQTNKSIYIYIP